MKLADLVVADRVRLPPAFLDQPDGATKGAALNEAVRGLLDRAPIIDATDVAEQIFASDSPLALSDFPLLAPPFPQFWLEYRRPPSAGAKTPKRWGVWVIEIPHEGIQRFIAGREKEWPAETWWGLGMTLYAEMDGQPYGPACLWDIALDSRGLGLQADWQGTTAVPRELADKAERSLATLMLCSLQTISFLHCRNVRTEPASTPPRVAAKQAKKLGRPPLRYSVVKIAPFGSKGSGGGRGGPSGPRRYHTVPGGFHHYGNCCPGVHEPHGLAFGKREGMFWVPMHARGNRRKGVVAHDYEIVLDEETDEDTQAPTPAAGQG
jgi:hypothetical protein